MELINNYFLKSFILISLCACIWGGGKDLSWNTSWKADCFSFAEMFVWREDPGQYLEARTCVTFPEPCGYGTHVIPQFLKPVVETLCWKTFMFLGKFLMSVVSHWRPLIAYSLRIWFYALALFLLIAHNGSHILGLWACTKLWLFFLEGVNES